MVLKKIDPIFDLDVFYYTPYPYPFAILKRFAHTLFKFANLYSYSSLISPGLYKEFSKAVNKILKEIKPNNVAVIDEIYHLLKIETTPTKRFVFTDEFRKTLSAVEQWKFEQKDEVLHFNDPGKMEEIVEGYDVVICNPPVTFMHTFRISESKLTLDLINKTDKVFILLCGNDGNFNDFKNFFEMFSRNKRLYRIHIPTVCMENNWIVILPKEINLDHLLDEYWMIRLKSYKPNQIEFVDYIEESEIHLFRRAGYSDE